MSLDIDKQELPDVVFNVVNEYMLFRIGFITTAYVLEEEKTATIVLIHTDKLFRGRGLATKLMNTIIDHYTVNKFKILKILIADGLDMMDKKIKTNIEKFYYKFGFIESNTNEYEKRL